METRELQSIATTVVTTLLGAIGTGGAIWKFLEYRQSLKKSNDESRLNIARIEAEREKAQEDADDRLLGRYDAYTARLEARTTILENVLAAKEEREKQLIQTNIEQQMEIKLLTKRIAELEKTK